MGIAVTRAIIQEPNQFSRNANVPKKGTFGGCNRRRQAGLDDAKTKCPYFPGTHGTVCRHQPSVRIQSATTRPISRGESS